MDPSNTKNIIWITSYPKSGNTWIRFLLLNCIYGQQNSSENIDTLIPDIHKCKGHIVFPSHGTTFIKTHLKMSPLMPLVDRSQAFIYIVRHPLDVMFSNLNYLFLTLSTIPSCEEKNRIKNDYIEQFINNAGDLRWVKSGMGSWREHVVGWLQNELTLPNIVLKYEDMLNNPMPQLIKINSFLNLKKSGAALQEAYENSSFEKMRSIEDKEIAEKKEGFFYYKLIDKTTDAGYRFMNKGKVSYDKTALSPDLIKAFNTTFGPLMQKLGYPAME